MQDEPAIVETLLRHNASRFCYDDDDNWCTYMNHYKDSIFSPVVIAIAMNREQILGYLLESASDDEMFEYDADILTDMALEADTVNLAKLVRGYAKPTSSARLARKRGRSHAPPFGEV